MSLSRVLFVVGLAIAVGATLEYLVLGLFLPPPFMVAALQA